MTVARTRTRRTTPGPATGDRRLVEPMLLDPSRCTCQRPMLVGTFRAEQLVALELRHLRSAGCAYPAQPVDVASWLRPW
ncbi:hypothetical protein [Micromonospora sp. NPDC023633]|uniref:hypothetical protein n=1 Tax=Micromonospora sp. NPDC023633 TaxID=3154320 RepID=UPI0033EC1E2A